MRNCMALAERYVGKGPDRVKYSGPCTLSHGHDGQHLPWELAVKQIRDQAFNEGLDASIATVSGLDIVEPELAVLIAKKIGEVRR